MRFTRRFVANRDLRAGNYCALRILDGAAEDAGLGGAGWKRADAGCGGDEGQRIEVD